MKKFLLALLAGLYLLPLSAVAKPITPSIHLMSLQAVKTQESSGDELYLDIVVYPKNKKPFYFHVPKAPLYWPSKHLAKVNNIKLWKDTLKDGDAVTLIISLIDKDAPPWNTDDLIGSVRVRLHNNNGQLESSWSMPNRVDAPVSVMSRFGRAEKFELLGEYSNYLMYLRLNAA